MAFQMSLCPRDVISRPHILWPPVSSTRCSCLNHLPPSVLASRLHLSGKTSLTLVWHPSYPTLMAARVFIVCLPACGPTQLLAGVKSDLLFLSPSASGMESSHVELSSLKLNWTQQNQHHGLRPAEVSTLTDCRVLWLVRESRMLLMDKSDRCPGHIPKEKLQGHMLAAGQHPCLLSDTPCISLLLHYSAPRWDTLLNAHSVHNLPTLDQQLHTALGIGTPYTYTHTHTHIHAHMLTHLQFGPKTGWGQIFQIPRGGKKWWLSVS